jgi:uncharacterized membrane protein YsdA (DUF1294 family)
VTATQCGWTIAAAYFVGVNVVTFAMYAWDKRAAGRNRRRVSERSLLTAALLGGSPAAFVAGRMLRHKTVKRSFRARFSLVVVTQVALIALVIYLLYRNP